jgi:hypothetical protein
MTDIANRVGLIYKIICNDLNVKDCYVGSCQAFRARKYAHKAACSNENGKEYNYNVYQFIRANGGWDNFSMLQIETVMFREKRELLTKERQWIETLGAKLNRHIPLRTTRERYQANKTQINEKDKEYYEANKTQIIKKRKEYYEANKTQINEKKKELIRCECGKSLTKSNITNHNKSKQHKQYQQVYNFIYS